MISERHRDSGGNCWHTSQGASPTRRCMGGSCGCAQSRGTRAIRGELVARRLFTSESVTEGPPDKIADQISDSILDALLAEDPKSRVAVETLITTGLVVVAGEV